jgi:hypothetical protein
MMAFRPLHSSGFRHRLLQPHCVHNPARWPCSRHVQLAVADAAVALVPSAISNSKQPQPLPPSQPRLLPHVIWVRGISWAQPAHEVAAAVQQCVVATLGDATALQHVAVPRATSAGAARAGWQHRGYALVSLADAAHADAVIAAVTAQLQAHGACWKFCSAMQQQNRMEKTLLLVTSM